MPMSYSRNAHFRNNVAYQRQVVPEMPAGPRLGRLYTARQVAQEIGLSPETVTRWASEGKVNAYRTAPNGPWRFRSQDIMRFLRENNSAIRR